MMTAFIIHHSSFREIASLTVGVLTAGTPADFARTLIAPARFLRAVGNPL